MTSIDDATWREIRGTFARSERSTLHSSVASINEDGSPHISPIGSVLLTDTAKGIYFDVFAGGLSRNLERDPRLTVLAVDSSRWFWLRSLIKGQFLDHPGYRLSGTAGPRREATEDEQRRMANIVRPLRWFKGHDLLWSNFGHVRDLSFESAKPIRLGKMTSHLMSAQSLPETKTV
ncbi:MAG: pyridoxamine 5'-phosphate oxidase family protein [Acidimicrobiales bacterium]